MLSVIAYESEDEVVQIANDSRYGLHAAVLGTDLQRDAKGQMAIFTADTHFAVHMDANNPTPTQDLHSREALAPVFADLNKYDATTHFIGQSTIYTLTSNRAIRETYYMAHHVTADRGTRRLMVASLRYHDTLANSDGIWLFDWLDGRALS